MTDLISVIVPVYNVAAYLPQCVESILSQDHGNLEVILIDDGSTDASGTLCDEFAAKDGRVRVIHQKNGGAAAAKNAGLRIAAGDYLCFADSDDYPEPGAYSHMLSVLKASGADMGEFSFRYVYQNRQEEMRLYEETRVISGTEYLRRFTQHWSCALLWNKLYKRSLFDGVFFEEGHRIDDEYFTYQGVLNAKTVVCGSVVVYNYRMRRSGAMGNTKAGEQRMLDRLDYMDKRRKIVARRVPALKRDFDTEYVDALTYFSEYADNSMASLKAIKKALRTYFLTPGNTLPPRYLIRKVMEVYITPVEKLLEACRNQQNIPDQSDYFP